jgi:hypothetical protein
MNLPDRNELLDLRIKSEHRGLFKDIELWKNSMEEGTVIRHHIYQFELLCRLMLEQLKESTTFRPERWSKMDPSTFRSLIISVLGGKWHLLRQVAEQHSASSPYLATLQDLDQFADGCYQRLYAVLKDMCHVEKLSRSSPLVYLGPIARLFLFDEQAPCLISAPFGAANDDDKNGKELCRETIPHEVGHAIFEQLPGLLDELRFKTETGLKKPKSKKIALIRSIILNWLEEMVADMTGTALDGRRFADSALQLNIMPDQMVGITDGYHPIPLLRSFVHGWVLKQIAPGSAAAFDEHLNLITADFIDRPFESLPAVITVTMREVKDELLTIAAQVWNCKLKSLDRHTLGEVFQAVYQTAAGDPRTPPAWGTLTEGSDEVIFRLVGPNRPLSPLPGLPLLIEPICCAMKWESCCNQTIS